jgi:hypothetical protein
MLNTRLQGAASPAPRPVPVLARALAAVAVGFGLLTLYSGGQVLFTEAARAAAGDYVPLVVWFNFLAGFAYVVAGIGLWRLRPWAAWLAAAIALSTLAVFAALGVHIAIGGAYEVRTVAAMTLRSLVWLAIAAAAFRMLGGGLSFRRPRPRT